MRFNAETQRTQRKRREDPERKAKRAHGERRHLPVRACQRCLRRSARPGLGWGGGSSETGSGEGCCRVGGGGGASQGWSPEKRMATPSSAYSRRTRWPSFFSRQMEKPG